MRGNSQHGNGREARRITSMMYLGIINGERLKPVSDANRVLGGGEERFQTRGRSYGRKEIQPRKGGLL